MTNNLFTELMQVSVGTRGFLSRVPTDEEWKQVLVEAQRHAIVGILACGIDRLPAEQRPPKMMCVQLAGAVFQIEQRNKEMTSACFGLCRRMEADGFSCCVLKGQANHAYYPLEMGGRRNSGDIDIWVHPINGFSQISSEKNVARQKTRAICKTVEYIQGKLGMTGLCWLHANCDVGGLPVEVHFRPSFFSRPKYNRRFQHYFGTVDSCVEQKAVDGVVIPAMRVEMDVIYQMNHIYRHLIDEGVGMRQVVDYFYCLKAYSIRVQEGDSIPSRDAVMEVVSWLGMRRFSHALMYVLEEVLGMPPEYLLCQPSVEDGSFLLDEILKSGNFGHHDSRMAAVSDDKGYLVSRLSQAWRRFKRNLRFLSSYPGEVLWEPVIRVAHFVWKYMKLWRFE